MRPVELAPARLRQARGGANKGDASIEEITLSVEKIERVNGSAI